MNIDTIAGYKIRTSSYSEQAVSILITLLVFLALPVNGYPIDMQQTQPVGGLEQEVAQQDMEDAFSLNEESNLGGLEIDTSEYDLIIEVPVEVENIYPIVTKVRIVCVVGKRSGDVGTHFEAGTVQSDAIVVDLEDGSYSGTLRFFFTLLPDQSPENVDFKLVNSALYNSESGGWYSPSYGPSSEGRPAWEVMAPGSHPLTFSPIEW